MKTKYLVKISYDGSKFYGWAKQPNLPTVQSEIEKKLSKLTRNKIKIHGSGRTDRYVHALNQYFTFSSKKKLLQKNIKKALNEIEGINCKKIKVVPSSFSSRFNAKEKTYLYVVDLKRRNRKRENDYAYNYFYDIDLKKLKEYSKLLIGKKDFASFTAKQDYENFVRNVLDIKITKRFKKLKFYIRGEGFMRYQVRLMVGSLLAHNRNKLTDEEFKDLIKNPKRGKSHYKAPGCGLYLKNVVYK